MRLFKTSAGKLLLDSGNGLRSLVLFVFLVEERTLQHEIGDGAIKKEQDSEHQKRDLFVDLRERSSDKVD